MLENISSIATTVSAFVAVCGAVIAWSVFRLAKKHFCHIRASSYIERYNNPEFAALRADVDQFLYVTENMDVESRGRVYRDLFLSRHHEDLLLRHQMWTFTMLFSEIGNAWKGKYIEDEMMQNFDRLIPRYLARLRPYIMNVHLNFGFPIPPEPKDTPDPPSKGIRGTILKWLTPRNEQRKITHTKTVLFKSFSYSSNKLAELGYAVDPEDLPDDLNDQANCAPLAIAIAQSLLSDEKRRPEIKASVSKRIRSDCNSRSWPDDLQPTAAPVGAPAGT